MGQNFSQYAKNGEGDLNKIGSWKSFRGSKRSKLINEKKKKSTDT